MSTCQPGAPHIRVQTTRMCGAPGLSCSANVLSPARSLPPVMAVICAKPPSRWIHRDRWTIRIGQFADLRFRSLDTAVCSSASSLRACERRSASSVSTSRISCAISRHSLSVCSCRPSLSALWRRVSGLCGPILKTSGIPSLIASMALLNCVSFSAPARRLNFLLPGAPHIRVRCECVGAAWARQPSGYDTLWTNDQRSGQRTCW